jgi:hypothetical protein
MRLILAGMVCAFGVNGRDRKLWRRFRPRRATPRLVGLWLRTVLGAEAAPFPAIRGRMVHSNDMQYAPLFSLQGTSIPVDALEKFRRFSGDHEVRRELPRGHGVDRHGLHAGRRSGKGLARSWWSRADARVEKQALFINGIGDFTFRVSAPSIDPQGIQRDTWTLPGIAVQVTSDAIGMTVQPGDGYADITHRKAPRFELRFEKR